MTIVRQMQPVGRLAPWPYESGTRDDGLDFTVKIEGVSGWFDLEDGVSYAVHSDSFATWSQTWRKKEVNNEWVEGTFPVSAVRENVSVPLVVYCKGVTRKDQVNAQSKLTAAIEQLSWMLMVRFEEVSEYWQCWASDYTVETQSEFRHAGISVVRVTVDRLPAVQYFDAIAEEQ